MPDPRDEDSGALHRATPPESHPDAVHDDDELASALAAQLLRFAPSGPIPIIRTTEVAPEAPAPAKVSGLAAAFEPTGPRFVAAPPARDDAGEGDDASGAAPAPAAQSGRPPSEPIPAEAVETPSEPTPAARAIAEIVNDSSATFLERAERLQNVLTEVDVDDSVYTEWEASLNSLAPGSPGVDPRTPEDAGPLELLVTRAPVARPTRSGPSSADRRASLHEAPADVPPVPITSSIPIGTPSFESVPGDEFVASAVLTGDLSEVVEAEVVDAEAAGSGGAEPAGNEEGVGNSDAVLDSSPEAGEEQLSDPSGVAARAAEVTRPPIPLTTGSVPLNTGSIPLITGSIPIVPAASGAVTLDTDSVPVYTGPIDLDIDDDADIDDVVAPMEAIPAAAAAAEPLPIAPPDHWQHTGPITPISTAQLIAAGAAPAAAPPADSLVEEPQPEPLLETIGIEPTPLDRRLAGAASQFWLWLAPNSSVLTFALGAALIGAGLSGRQAIIAALFGVVLACLPLALSTLAVKRAGQPTAIVSRASFGIVGNILPAVLLLLVRLFWLAILLWLLAVTCASLVFESGYDLFIAPGVAAFIALVVFGALAGTLAVFGHRMLVRVHGVLAAVGGAVALVVILFTAPLLDVDALIGTADGDWLGVIAGAITVFSLLGTAWAATGGDLARYQGAATSGSATATAAGVGAGAPALALIAWGVLLAGSDDTLAAGLQRNPVATLAAVLPGWYPLLLLAAIVISIVSGVSVIAYSGGLTLLSLGVRTTRAVATGAVALVGVLTALGLVVAMPSLEPILMDLAPTIAVPVFAWVGIVAGELLIRHRAYDSAALLTRGEAYPDFRWGNLVALVLITVVGLGLVAGSDGLFLFEGYLWSVFGVDTSEGVGAADLGVPVAVLLGLLTGLVSGRVVRGQEGTVVSTAGGVPHVSRVGSM